MYGGDWCAVGSTTTWKNYGIRWRPRESFGRAGGLEVGHDIYVGCALWGFVIFAYCIGVYITLPNTYMFVQWAPIV